MSLCDRDARREPRQARRNVPRLGLAVGSLGLALALGAATPPRPEEQAPPRPPAPTIPASVEIMQVDVVVVDRAGRPVAGLSASDFELRAGGRPQPIANFAYVSAAQPGRARTAPPERAPEGSDPRPAGGVPAREPGVFLIVVDPLGLGPSSVAAVRAALERWSARLEPDARVGLLRAGVADERPLDELLTDRAALRGAIAAVRHDARERGSAERPQAMLPQALGGDGGFDVTGEQEAGMRAVDALRGRHFALDVYGTLARAVHLLAPLPGRKHVCLVTQALPGVPAGIVDGANRARVVVHTLDPRGPVAGFPVHDPRVPFTHAGFEASVQSRTDAVARERQVLARLAEATGGLAVHGTNDLVGALERIASEQQGYYLLGYVPAASTPEAQRPRKERVEVRVKVRGLTVRARATAQAREIGAP